MSDNQTKCACCGYFICANRHMATKSDTCPDVLPIPTTPTIPDFGPEADKAISAACAQFPDMFRLRNHKGTFRVSRRNSYVSRGVVMLYTQRLMSITDYTNLYGREPADSSDCWVDFAKGTLSELKSQMVAL